MQEQLMIIFKLKLLGKFLKAMEFQMDLFVLIANNQILNVLITKLDIVALNHNINVKIKIGLLGSIEICLQDLVTLKHWLILSKKVIKYVKNQQK